MKFYSSSLLLLLVTGFQLVQAQKNFVPGYLINNAGDTVKGYILDKGWDQNPKSIQFKKKIEDQEIEYLPHEISGFGTPNKIYQAEILDIDKSEHRSTKISTGVTNRSSVVDSVFLEVLIRGTLSLFLLNDENNKVHFFASKNYSTPQELIVKRFLSTQNSKTFIATVDLYKGFLKAMTSDCSSVSETTESVRYNQKELKKLFLSYNSCNGNANGYIAKKEKVEFQFLIGAGISLTSLDFKGASTTIVNNKYPVSINPSMALGINTVFPRSRQKWSVYTEMQYRSYQTAVLNSTFDFSYLRLNAAYRYNYPQGIIRPFVQAGISYGIAVKSETNLSSFRKDEQGLFGGIGLRKNKLSLEGRYESTNAMSEFIVISSYARSFFLIFSYRL